MQRGILAALAAQPGTSYTIDGLLQAMGHTELRTAQVESCRRALHRLADQDLIWLSDRRMAYGGLHARHRASDAASNAFTLPDLSQRFSG